MAISCHFRDCKALLVTSSRVSRPLPFCVKRFLWKYNRYEVETLLVGWVGWLADARPVLKVKDSRSRSVQGQMWKNRDPVSPEIQQGWSWNFACRQSVGQGWCHPVFDLHCHKETAWCRNNSKHVLSLISQYNRSEVEILHLGTVWWEADAR